MMIVQQRRGSKLGSGEFEHIMLYTEAGQGSATGEEVEMFSRRDEKESNKITI